MLFAKKIAFTALLAATVYAQNPTDSSSTDLSSTVLPSTDTSSAVNPTSSISPCILTCATSSTLCTFTDATCVCVNTQYQQAVAACLQSQCTTADVAQAQAIQQALCAGSSASSLLSSASSHISSQVSSISSRLSSLTNTKTSSTSTSTGSSGSGGAAGLSASLIATGGAVLLGVIGGGLLVF